MVDDTTVIFYSRYLELKKKSKIREFLAKLRFFFPGAPIWSWLFGFELWVTVHATVFQLYPITILPTQFS